MPAEWHVLPGSVWRVYCDANWVPPPEVAVEERAARERERVARESARDARWEASAQQFKRAWCELAEPVASLQDVPSPPGTGKTRRTRQRHVGLSQLPTAPPETPPSARWLPPPSSAQKYLPRGAELHEPLVAGVGARSKLGKQWKLKRLQHLWQ